MASTYASASAQVKRSVPRTVFPAYPYSSKQDSNPFGAAMADSIFDTYEYDECSPCDVEEAYNHPVPDNEEYWYQTELPLENLRQLEDRMRHQIKKFERSYKKMMVSALQWHYLQQECEDNAQVEKMFNDMQMVRKLTGSDKV